MVFLKSSLLLLALSAVAAPLLPGVACYNRPAPRGTLSVPTKDSDPASPEQVHISLVGGDKMRISWITQDKNSTARVDYGTSTGLYEHTVIGITRSYSYLFYKSGQIHDAIVGPLMPEKTYYYRCSDLAPEYSFKTPPAQLPIKFAVVGDLGQTGWTESTLKHINASNYDVLLLPGDLSYADYNQLLWDSFGRLVEPLASKRPWMVTQGNHEIEKIPLIEADGFKSYNARWRMPYEESNSTSNLYYSFDVAGCIHVLMLGSYTDFEEGSAQYEWLKADLSKVDRANFPWLIALLHVPWYNSNTAHQGEGEKMRNAIEEVLYEARVDVVFAGHVHAYERFARVNSGRIDNCGPVYITIGDGGNKEGLAGKFLDPQPEISLFREASFGHGQLEVMNATHSLWSWHRNDDEVSVVADQFWLKSLTSDPSCQG